MTPRRILIVYGTKYGHTLKVAECMADSLMRGGAEVRLIHASAANRAGDLEIAEFDGVIVGSSVIAGRHDRAVRRFVREHPSGLATMPTAFFSVSGAAGSKQPADHARALRYVNEFLAETGWRPAMTDAFGGAMAYTKYNPLLRWIIRRASMREGGPADTSRDHESTDWAQVEEFARGFGAMVEAVHQREVPAGV